MSGQHPRPKARSSFARYESLRTFSSIWIKPSEKDVKKAEAQPLSDIGRAIGKHLTLKNFFMHRKSWNVTTGYIVGQVQQTPFNGWNLTEDPEEGHDFWFPEKIREIISRTKVFCDIMTLGIPTGKFIEAIKKALLALAQNNSDVTQSPIIVRFLVAKIPGFALNLKNVLKTLTELLPDDCNVRIWMGAWRRGPSWNHAKIIAVDGEFLWTGGHNFWDEHYLRTNPVADLSIELCGEVTHDAHNYANEQWKFIKRKHDSSLQYFINHCYPKSLPLPTQSRISITRHPKHIKEKYPPSYDKNKIVTNHSPNPQNMESPSRMITIGRYGKMNDGYAILRKKRASDDALVTMFNSAKFTIQMAIQDIGPVCIPKTKLKIIGTKWPRNYLQAISSAICDRDVKVEICLSNPHSIPGGLSPFQAQYGNGWTCEDVIFRIARTMKNSTKFKLQSKKRRNERVERLINENLKVCFIANKNGNKWADGKTLGMHAKHYIVDGKICYVGSQNLYDCDLGEWGVIIDDRVKTQELMNQYWRPMWESSFAEGTAKTTLSLATIEKEIEKTDSNQTTNIYPAYSKLCKSLRYGTVNVDLSMIEEGSESESNEIIVPNV